MSFSRPLTQALALSLAHSLTHPPFPPTPPLLYRPVCRASRLCQGFFPASVLSLLPRRRTTPAEPGHCSHTFTTHHLLPWLISSARSDSVYRPQHVCPFTVSPALHPRCCKPCLFTDRSAFFPSVCLFSPHLWTLTCALCMARHIYSQISPPPCYLSPPSSSSSFFGLLSHSSRLYSLVSDHFSLPLLYSTTLAAFLSRLGALPLRLALLLHKTSKSYDPNKPPTRGVNRSTWKELYLFQTASSLPVSFVI
ncbi:hypothetical protein IF1G_05120 [Cordyceps javanica]|uniref:Uncharacterized protein n=1 Tax=Cordyceps javanica TaxID=43265 RepID=A0A545V497_9HYPO|nr:hypothetical protein IF1G_05120 [Cordyceps javanica]